MKNEQIWSWFEDGKVEEALRGNGSFFIPDITFREEHNLILVIGQLILWATGVNAQKAAEAFDAVVRSYIGEGNLGNAIDLYLTYRIIADEDKGLPLEESKLRDEIAALMNKKASDISHDENLRSLSVRFLSKYPELNEKVGLSSD